MKTQIAKFLSGTVLAVSVLFGSFGTSTVLAHSTGYEKRTMEDCREIDDRETRRDCRRCLRDREGRRHFHPRDSRCMRNYGHRRHYEELR